LYRCASVLIWAASITLRADAVTAIKTHVTAKATNANLSGPICKSFDAYVLRGCNVDGSPKNKNVVK
jgi:hypothetical protein